MKTPTTIPEAALKRLKAFLDQTGISPGNAPTPVELVT
jgi:hypothetical protein